MPSTNYRLASASLRRGLSTGQASSGGPNSLRLELMAKLLKHQEDWSHGSDFSLSTHQRGGSPLVIQMTRIELTSVHMCT